MTSILMDSEGVITTVPGTETRNELGIVTAPGIRAERYTSLDAVPLFDRMLARQIGAAGFWYVPIGDTLGITWDKATDQLWATADKAVTAANESLGLDRGVLGLFSKLLGIPYPLSVALVLFIGYALLRGAGLVPPLTRVAQ